MARRQEPRPLTLAEMGRLAVRPGDEFGEGLLKLAMEIVRNGGQVDMSKWPLGAKAALIRAAKAKIMAQQEKMRRAEAEIQRQAAEMGQHIEQKAREDGYSRKAAEEAGQEAAEVTARMLKKAVQEAQAAADSGQPEHERN